MMADDGAMQDYKDGMFNVRMTVYFQGVLMYQVNGTISTG